MKIIEKGEDRLKRIICPNCNSLLEYNYKDISQPTVTDKKGKFHSVLEKTVTCPSCHDHIREIGGWQKQES